MTEARIVVENIQGKKFGPIGECIYCGSDGGRDRLRSEHIIPFSLGGKAELLEASCVTCGAITSYIDGYLAAHTYYDLRLSMPNFPTRRRKRHPRTRSAQITFVDREERREFATGAHPFFTILPVWGLPGILRNVQPRAEFPPSKVFCYTYAPDDIGEQLRLKVGEIAKIKEAIPLNLAAFGRAMAKIAYCQAIAGYGLRGFRPLVMPDLILGRYPCIPHFVGNQAGDPPPADRSKLLHQVGFKDAMLGNQKLIVALIRLFANCGTAENGMPIYNVVVGAPR